MEHSNKKVNPQFDFVVGGVCSGKSYFIKQKYTTGYKHIDAGEIFIELSKGKYYDFPSSLENQMNKIGSEFLNKAISEKANIVMELIGDDSNEISPLIDALKRIGYEVNLVGLDSEVETALERNKNRSDDNISAFYTQKYHFKWLKDAIRNAVNGKRK